MYYNRYQEFNRSFDENRLSRRRLSMNCSTWTLFVCEWLCQRWRHHSANAQSKPSPQKPQPQKPRKAQREAQRKAQPSPPEGTDMKTALSFFVFVFWKRKVFNDVYVYEL